MLPPIIYLFVVIGFPIFLVAQIQMLKNIMLPFPIQDILHADSLVLEVEHAHKKRGLLAEGMYKLCRNPMYSGMMMCLIGVSRVVTLDRLLFNGLMFVGIIYGVRREEHKMRQEFEDYQEYANKIPNRYIPIFSNIWKKL